MKEENLSPVSASGSPNLAAFSAIRQRFSPMPYPYIGQPFPYIPWEWMSHVPAFSMSIDQRWQSMARARCEQLKLHSQEESLVPEPRKSPLPTEEKSPSSPSQQSPVIKFSIEDILNRKEPSRRRSFDPIGNASHITSMLKSEFEIPDGESFNTTFDTSLMDTSKYSWLQCTRYRPPKLPRLKKKETGKKRKLGRNPRVPFTQHQVAALEHKFHRTHYLSSADVAELSTALNLTETRVKIWFQNRRARERRDREGVQRSDRVLTKTAASVTTSSFPMPAILSWSTPTTRSHSPLTAFSNPLLSGGKSAFKPIS